MVGTGVIVATSRTGTVYRVLLDGRRRPVQLHVSYIEPLVDPPREAAASGEIASPAAASIASEH
jgi:hypothetical protein